MKPEIKLINKYKPEPVDVAFYIGRGSGLGNPYSHIDSKYPDVIKVKDRETACAEFEKMFDKHIKNSSKPPAKAKALLDQMEHRLKQGKSIGLICFCGEGIPCHGRTIRSYLEERLNAKS